MVIWEPGDGLPYNNSRYLHGLRFSFIAEYVYSYSIEQYLSAFQNVEASEQGQCESGLIVEQSDGRAGTVDEKQQEQSGNRNRSKDDGQEQHDLPSAPFAPGRLQRSVPTPMASDVKRSKGHEQQARNRVEYRPRLPYLMIRTVACEVQIDPCIERKYERRNQYRIRKKHRSVFIHRYRRLFCVRIPNSDSSTAICPHKV